MQNFKLKIEYDGTDFCGWQIQKKGERTVQSEIKRACDNIFKSDVTVIASGRTDKGVHAEGQVVHFHVETRMRAEEIQKALNSCLPKDIAVLDVKKASQDFHAQYDAKEKTYRYIILNGQHRSAFLRNHVYYYQYPLNLTKMRKAAKVLIGRHDFKSFQAHDPLRVGKDTIRTIKQLTIKKDGDFLIVDITADGFLYKMVRNIVGTLLAIGSGLIPVEDMQRILKKKDRAKASATAPSQGLCLLRVKY